MDRRALLASLGSTATSALAGCSSAGSNSKPTNSRTTTDRPTSATTTPGTDAVESVSAGDVVSLPAGTVELGPLAVQSSFHRQVNLAWEIVGRRGELLVVLDLDVAEYDQDVHRLPLGIEVDGERNPAGSEAPVHSLNRPSVRVGVSVPTGSGKEFAVLLDGGETTYRYPLPGVLQKQIREPPAWNVDVSFPDRVRSDGELDITVTAENTGASEGTLVGAVTHDRIYDKFWDFDVNAAPGERVTETVSVTYVGGEAGDLSVSASWGLGHTSETVAVVTNGSDGG
ncbi:hypothetical protein [Halorussus ruber]|uniref:hypothetical protein n=1 Tax=Halorussus ruber TaxID=1126238 RepID=UPI001091AD4B|nr:hypothetical protein [Halorussus ruber]